MAVFMFQAIGSSLFPPSTDTEFLKLAFQITQFMMSYARLTEGGGGGSDITNRSINLVSQIQRSNSVCPRQNCNSQLKQDCIAKLQTLIQESFKDWCQQRSPPVTATAHALR